MSERRYDDREVAEIFEHATEAHHRGALRPSNAAEGLTLAELKEIGRDVGIAPELVEHAARALDAAPSARGRTVLGLPIRVGHAIELPRRLTEEEWQRLVVNLRDTFDARGRLRDDGAFKQWTNGNLEVLLEPTPAGQRLRMRTYKETAMGLILGGGITLTIAVVALMAALMGMGREIGERLPGLVTLFAVGSGLLGAGALQLPAWARLRRSQMEAIAERAALMAGSDPEDRGATRSPGSS